MTQIRLVLMFYFFMVPHKAEWVTDEVYCSVVLALLQVAFLGKWWDWVNVKDFIQTIRENGEVGSMLKTLSKVLERMVRLG